MTTTTARRTIVLGPEGNLSVADETLSRQAEKMSLKEGRLGMDTAENPQREMQTSETDKPEMDETAHNDEGMAPGETNEGEINNLDTQGRGMHPALLKNLPSNERDLNATEASIYSEQNDLPDGEQAMSGHDNVDEEFRGHALGPNDDSKMALGSALATDPAEMNESREVQGMEEDHPNGDAMSTRTGATTRTGITNRTGVTNRTGATRPT